MKSLLRLGRFLAPFAAAAAAGYGMEAGAVSPYWIQIFQLACIMAVSALGLNIIYGFTGLFSLGHAAFYGIGAYTAAFLMKSYGGESQIFFLASLLAGGAAAATVAGLVGLPTLRLTSDYLGIATLGLSVLVVRNLVSSSFGRALIAIREDETAASTLGIDTFRCKMAGFVVGCAFAGLAGGLYAHLYAFLHPSNFDFFKSVDVLVIVVLGGLGNMSGTLVASFGWIFLLEGLRVILPPGYIELRWVLIPVLLIVTMLLRPQGLFGIREFRFLRGESE